MSETEIYSTTINSEQHSRKTGRKHVHHHAPHDGMVGSIITFIIVGIVMNGLFYGVWWAFIPQLVSFVHMIKAIVNYSKDKESRENYVYSTSSDEVVQMWVAFVIVSIVMNALFSYIWFAPIPISVLLVKAIVKSVEYGKTKKQAKNPSPQPITVTVAYQQPVNQAPLYEIPPRVEQPGQFCPMCGTPHRDNSSFCPACGNKL